MPDDATHAQSDAQLMRWRGAAWSIEPFEDDAGAGTGLELSGATPIGTEPLLGVGDGDAVGAYPPSRRARSVAVLAAAMVLSASASAFAGASRSVGSARDTPAAAGARGASTSMGAPEMSVVLAWRSLLDRGAFCPESAFRSGE
jgi:hypothetical protein